MRKSPSIAIVGAGAMGGYYGARLAQHGHDVHFLLRSDYDAVRANGWTIKSWQGDFRVAADQLHAYNDARRMPRVDLVLVTLKSTSADLYEPLIRPLLGDGTAILTLQNGLGNEEQLSEVFGPERIIGGLAYICSTRVAPGVIDHTFNGRILQLAELPGGGSDRVRRFAELFNSSGVPAEILDDLPGGKWRKLVWNVPFGGLGALLDLTTDALLADRQGVQLVRGLMQEIVDAAGALGHRMPPDLIEQMIPFTLRMGHYRSSMQIDRREGRPMELEAILGEPLRQAHDVGVDTPKLELLYEMLSLIDARRSAG